MKTTIPNLRKIIRKVIVESMSPSDPDYDTVAEVIAQVNRRIMFGMIEADEESVELDCREYADEYGVPQHFDYIVSKCMQVANQFAPSEIY